MFTLARVRNRLSVFAIVLVGLFGLALAGMTTAYAATTGVVTNGGNLRQQARVANNVIGQVCPGDRFTVLTEQRVGQARWLQVRLTTLAENCDPARVAAGTEGWVNSTLVRLDGAPAATARPAQPTARPARPTAVPQQSFDRNGDGKVTCADFSTRSQALAALRAGHGNLDRDNDGIPCESLPQ